MLSSLWALTKNAFTEIIRQPIYGILVGVGVVLIALSPLIAMFTLLENDKLVVDMGLATIFLIGLVLAVLSASQIISREIDSKTAGAVISKPIGRFLFVAGKFLGVTLAMLVATYLFTLVLLITLRIGVPSAAWYQSDWPAMLGLLLPFFGAVLLGFYCNYFYRWSFGATTIMCAIPLYGLAFFVLLTITPDWQFQWVPQVYIYKSMYEVFLAAIMVFLGVWVVSSIAVAASTRLNVVPNVVICAGVFFVGMVSRYLFGQYADTSYAAWVAYRLVPNLQAFWVADQLMGIEPYIPVSYVAMVAGYAVAFSAAMITLAAYLFEQRELI